jgi:hypothetical protein
MLSKKGGVRFNHQNIHLKQLKEVHGSFIGISKESKGKQTLEDEAIGTSAY